MTSFRRHRPVGKCIYYKCYISCISSHSLCLFLYKSYNIYVYAFLNLSRFANFSYLRKLDFLLLLIMIAFMLTFIPFLFKLVFHGENVVATYGLFKYHVAQLSDCRYIYRLSFASSRYFRALVDCIS